MEEIIGLMNSQGCIRNVAIVAHIDHGKTTLSDSLLSASGYLSSDLAGSVRVLDYLEEEQSRGITIKAANISLLFDYNNQPYLVNLVDTPGHVDFTGNVTRALRVIDGVVVVIDAVEGIMAQTETVTRQALSEYVKPILFVNKVDRLISELKLIEAEIQVKLKKIILDFNNLIENYSEGRFTREWKVDAVGGSASFGSALDGWGFNYNMFSKKNLKFRFIIDRYLSGEKSILKSMLPVQEPVIQGIINHIPPPNMAQKYRIGRIWVGEPDTEAGINLVNCNTDGPVILAVSNVLYDPQLKYILTARIFSGTVKKGQSIVSLSDDAKHSIQQLFLLMGPSREPIEKAAAGNIIGIGGLDNVRSGDTLVEEGLEFKMIPFERIRYVSEPVVTVSLEPVKLSQLPSLVESLEFLAIQDPNLRVSINKETGEYLLSGIGELHLEITINKLRDNGLDIIASEPMVIYRESVRGSSERSFEGSSSIRKIKLGISPLPAEMIDFLSKYGFEGKDAKKALNSFKRSFSDNELAQRLLHIFPNENILVAEAPDISRNVLDILIETLHSKLSAGLLCEEPVRGVILHIKELDLDVRKLNLAELTSAISDLFNSVYRESEPVLLEPIFKIQVTAPADLIGKVSSLITQKRGRIEKYINGKISVTINGVIPVRESFELSDELRSKTSGRAFWQTQFHNWQTLNKREEEQILREIRERKGI